MDVKFPFPDEETSRPLLEQDPEYGKIPPDEVENVFRRAWQTGVDAAEQLLEQETERPLDFFAISRKNSIQIISSEKDNVAANTRYYSEFYPKDKKIYLYNDSIRLWCAANGLSLANGRMLILSHEFFHFLESTTLGWTSKQYEVPMARIGGLTLGKTGCPSLSEIAANAFAFTCFPHLLIDEAAEIIPEEVLKPADSGEPKKKITFWNQRREELREVYNQFFKL